MFSVLLLSDVPVIDSKRHCDNGLVLGGYSGDSAGAATATADLSSRSLSKIATGQRWLRVARRHTTRMLLRPFSPSDFPVPPDVGLTAEQPACPMHKRTIEALGSAAPSPSSCPVPHGGGSTTTTEASSSTLSRLNPLIYMFRDLSQAPAPNQAAALPTSREESTIPKGGGTRGNWEYPSPQQMYNALLRKGYSDTDVTAVESMVAVHNFLNAGAWAEIVEWERRFGRGLRRGWDICRRGEENADETARRFEIAEARAAGSASPPPPTLVRFQGRPKDMTPKAAMVQVMGWLYPAKFG